MIDYFETLKCKSLFDFPSFNKQNGRREKKMKTLKEYAKEYIPQQTKNICELKRVSVDVILNEEQHINKDTNEEFTIKFITINGEKYRVPGSVIGDLKGILKKQPNINFVSVTKTGTGMSTRYQVIPIQDNQQESIVVTNEQQG